MSTRQKKTVGVIGIWHLGIVNAVGLAEKGYRVIGVELNSVRAKELQAGQPPLLEKGVPELMKKHLETKQLSFSDDPSTLREADYIIVATDTPVDENGNVNLDPILHIIKRICPFTKPRAPIVIQSQVPLGTCEKIEEMVHKSNPNWRSGVAYVPENLKLGQAVERFLKPDMIVIGANTPEILTSVLKLYQPFRTKKVTTNLRTAELFKHSLNTFLALSISFINEIAHLADRLGADALTVGNYMKLDTRVGSKALLRPGLGYAGGTLARDVTQLRKFSKELSYPGQLVESIAAVNDLTFKEVVVKVRHYLHELKGKKIGFLGLTYKPGTSTLRCSSAVRLAREFKKTGAICLAYDPEADDKELAQYPGLVERVNSPQDLAAQADILVLVTEWPEFPNLDYVSLAKTMAQPILIDTKNCLDGQKIAAAGFTYQGYGRKALTKGD